MLQLQLNNDFLIENPDVLVNVPIELSITQVFTFGNDLDEPIDTRFALSLNVWYEFTDHMLYDICDSETVDDYTELEPIEMEVIDLE